MAKKFENIFIASDLDGTYFDSKSSIVQRNVERVKYFCENGGHFTFATGRLPIFIKKHIPNPLPLINFAAVMGNGTCLFDYQKGEAIEEYFLDTDLIAEVEAFIYRHAGVDAAIRATYDKGVLMSTLQNEKLKHEFDTFPSYIERVVCPAREWGGYKLYKSNIRGNADVIEPLYPLVQKEFSDVLTVTTSSKTMIELMPYGTSKAAMLQNIKEKYFGGKIMLCTVGDYDNDLAMHSIADLPVCPANANAAVKEICKLHLCSNDEGVIGDLVDYFDKNM